MRNIKSITILGFLLIAAFLVGCDRDSVPSEPNDFLPSEFVYTGQEQELKPEFNYTDISVSEVMVKNTAFLRDENGVFLDWAELYNCGSEQIDLCGFALSDGENQWIFPSHLLGANDRVIVFFGGTGELHVPFSLSKDETLFLFAPNGDVLSQITCENSQKNMTLVIGKNSENEKIGLCRYPSPGYENTADGYSAWQESLSIPEGLLIWEVSVDGSDYFDTTDWVELYNNSAESIQIDDYWLSDDEDAPDCFRLPSIVLEPGNYYVVDCDKSITGFSLDSESDELYLYSNGHMIDAIPLQGIPAGGSCGRISHQPGWFYFAQSSRGKENSDGKRRVSKAPVALSGDGLYDAVDAVDVILSADGTIYYTTDGSDPVSDGLIYKQPFSVEKTSIIKAVAREQDALPSKVSVISCLVNENSSLPVVSLCTNQFRDASTLLNSKRKLSVEVPGTIALYDEFGHAFTTGCGINLSGVYSLNLSKKSFKLHFRSCYGDSALKYDLFGDGIEQYSSITLRKGQDSTSLVFRSELWEELCRKFSTHVITQNSRFCNLFLNGEYYGICSLREDFSRQFYASHYHVSKDSVEWEKLPISKDGAFYQEVISLCEAANGHLSDEQYEAVCDVLDIDSFIDWMLIEGVSANSDFYSNAAFFRSTENGGKWKLALFDLDHAFESPFYGLFGYSQYPNHYITLMCKTLSTNAQFQQRLLTRYAEVWQNELSSESVIEIMNQYENILRPEISRDFTNRGYSSGLQRWLDQVAKQRKKLEQEDWETNTAEALFKAAGWTYSGEPVFAGLS